jgi:hypothetical protein
VDRATEGREFGSLRAARPRPPREGRVDRDPPVVHEHGQAVVYVDLPQIRDLPRGAFAEQLAGTGAAELVDTVANSRSESLPVANGQSAVARPDRVRFGVVRGPDRSIHRKRAQAQMPAARCCLGDD